MKVKNEIMVVIIVVCVLISIVTVVSISLNRSTITGVLKEDVSQESEAIAEQVVDVELESVNEQEAVIEDVVTDEQDGENELLVNGDENVSVDLLDTEKLDGNDVAELESEIIEEEAVEEEISVTVTQSVPVSTGNTVNNTVTKLTAREVYSSQSVGFNNKEGKYVTNTKDANMVYQVSGEYALVSFEKTIYTGIGEIYINNRFIKSVDTNSVSADPNQVEVVRIDVNSSTGAELKIVADIGFGQELEVISVIVYE